MKTFAKCPGFIRNGPTTPNSTGYLKTDISMLPLPPFNTFKATKNLTMRFNGDHLEVVATVDMYPHLRFYIYIHKDDLHNEGTLPIDPSGLPGTAYAGFIADKLYDGTKGELSFCYHGREGRLDATLHFEAAPYRFSDGVFEITGLEPPVK
ncbi:hypothetical protein RJC98_06340 [Pseudomonas allii]|uniref:Uncharacterized protein n=2 Tax=Pseudomonas allii TaxID=2740531 RepID=A0ACC6L978_9PSED|nr:hypothetical protein [Pseudomonas allii]MDR9874789.1 hypothetical protein [Pseudomonas allii]NWN51310.1 hypothetical protein [Pseudomonas allii]NWN61604.1 hypothetical protein [Pseudomonas allii]